MKTNHGTFWTLAMALVTMFTLQARAATVTATLDPSHISMGDSAQLTVTVSGSQEQPSVPNVDGLDITSVSQTSNFELNNGALTMSASTTYEITPQHDGTFVIPAIHASGAASQPITLTVGKGSGTASSTQQTLPPPGAGPVVLPPPAVAPPASANATSTPEGQFGSIEVTLPKKEFYLGELVPVEIKAYIPANIQGNITDLPQFTSDGFTLNALSPKLDRNTEIVNGRPYTVLTWHSALTGVKTGDYPVSLQMPLTVIVPQQMPQDANDMFNNFFRNAFAAMGTKKDVTIQSAAETLKVLPLPQANRPADFSGAVGQFEIEASAAPTSVNAGDPITLRLKVTGTGSFDRVSSDMLAGDSHWKTYSPKSHFDPADNVGYQGEKTFEQPIIPNDASVSAIPSVSFSYFDPETRQYVTRTTAPVAVTVSGSSVNPATTPSSGAGVASATPQPQPSSSSPSAPDDLRANKIEPGTFASTLRPIYLNPWFIASQSLPLLALLGGLAFIRRQKRAAHPERVRATAVQQAIRQQIEAMDEALQNHQTDAFFVHARGALQQRFGHQWNMRPETITLADIEARLGDEIETVRPIFEMADQASYSDLHFADADLRQWREAVVNQLTEKN